MKVPPFPSPPLALYHLSSTTLRDITNINTPSLDDCPTGECNCKSSNKNLARKRGARQALRVACVARVRHLVRLDNTVHPRHIITRRLSRTNHTRCFTSLTSKMADNRVEDEDDTDVICAAGLAWLLTFWTIAGAAAFYATEGPRERAQVFELKGMQRDLAVSLAMELRQFKDNVEAMEPMWSNKVNNYISKHERMILSAVNSGYGEGGDTPGGQLWTFSGCVLFTISLITTLGFGAPVPRTTSGRTVAVIFAALGIPAHFLLIFNLSLFLAMRLQNFAIRKKYGTHSDINGASHKNIVPKWVKVVPFIWIASYYLIGIIGFGAGRSRPLAASVLFPLDFTAAGGLATISGVVRIVYGLYLEGAVTIAAMAVAVLRVSATESLTNIGIKYGLLIEAY